MRTRSERDYDDDGRRRVKKEIGLRITEQEGGKRPRNGAGKIDLIVRNREV